MMYYLSGSGYQGPGDVVSGFTGWWGLRGFSKAVAATGTQKAINVRRASDSATSDILILPNGKLDVATLTTFLASTTGFVTKFYDQSGGGKDASQVTTAKQPQILLTGGPGASNPTVNFVGSSSQALVTASVFGMSSGGSISWLGIRTGAFTTAQAMLGGQGGTAWNVGGGGTANTIEAVAGVSGTAAATDNVWHAVNAIVTLNSSTSGNFVDGVFTQASLGSNPMLVVCGIGGAGGAAFFATGGFVEGGLTSTIMNSTQYAAMNSNMHGANGWNF